jgi:GTPase SAR1 family protein
VIIVGNKKEEQPLDINRRALREKYPNIKAIIETSCLTNEGIDELRQAIFHEVGQLKEVYDLLPLSWFEVKEYLEKMDEDFISYSKYACICEAKKIPEEHNQEQPIDLLHRLGLVLNFRNHPILQSTNVLNPDWVTQGIYALLSDETLKTKTKGLLTYDDLNRILDSQRSFLLIIRDVFNKIHNSFTQPEVSDWVPVPGHPKHPPLDYQELLGLEAMGEIEYPIGKLKLKVNLRQLLDGYEPLEIRQERRTRDRDFARMEPQGIKESLEGRNIGRAISSRHSRRNYGE